MGFEVLVSITKKRLQVASTARLDWPKLIIDPSVVEEGSITAGPKVEFLSEFTLL